MAHEHEPFEASATNKDGTMIIQVCRCGATRRIWKGVPDRYWHTCKLCTHPWGLKEEGKTS